MTSNDLHEYAPCYDCICHREYSYSNHEECCGNPDGRNADCPTHGDGGVAPPCVCGDDRGALVHTEATR